MGTKFYRTKSDPVPTGHAFTCARINIETDKVQNLPEGFVYRMQRLLGDEYPQFAESYLNSRVQGLRINKWKGNLAQMKRDCCACFSLEPVFWTECGYYYGREDRPGKHPYHEAGVYYIQEPSAMAVVEALGPVPGDRVLDLCAAPGGKSTQIAACLQGKGLLVSNEIHPARAKILSQNIERMGAANVVVTNHDAQTMARWLLGFFDKIVVDAPCSGEGMFRKEPEARAEWTPDSPGRCSLRQREILDSAAIMLKPGGLMVYSTCTFAPEENEGTIEAFLQKHPEFSIEKTIGQKKGFSRFGKGQPKWVAGGGRKELEDTFRLWPHQINGEGHYLAVLRKTVPGWMDAVENSKDTAEKKKGKSQNGKRKKDLQKLKDREWEAVFLQFCQETFRSGDWRRLANLSHNPSGGQGKEQRGNYLLFGEQLYYTPLEMPELTGKKVLRPGLHLGTFKKKRFEPSHALALYLSREQVKQELNLDSGKEEVIRYLKGETLIMDNLPIDNAASGWVLITVDGYSLGWGKLAGGRLQNHYPKGLRWG